MRALEFYSGIGGLHLALSRVDREHKVVRAFDWDQTACRVYEANHGKDIVEKVDISGLTPGILASYNAEIWLLSPACQPYTVLNPNARGALDPRAHSYLHLLQDVIPGLVGSGHAPKYILVENVAGYESSTTRRVQNEVLKAAGYWVRELLVNPLQLGIPNSRLRYYMLAKRTAPFEPAGDEEEGDEEEEKVWRYIPDELHLEASNEEENQEIRVYLDSKLTDEEEEEYSVPDKILGKWGRLFDIVLPSSKRTCCFTRGYTHLVERSGSILQVDEDLDTTSTFDEFARVQKAQSQASHGSSPDFISSLDDPLQILHPLRLRYFTPSELLRIFGFDRIEGEQGDNTSRKFVWPSDVSKKSKYKLIGNSVSVRVVEKIVRYLLN